MDLSRRSLLAVAGAATLAACGEDVEPVSTERVQQTVSLGDHPAQMAVLTIPKGKVTGLVVLIHGGGWMAGAGPASFANVAAGFESLGVATWNIGYRGIEDQGGWPSTFEDVAAAVDAVPGQVKKHRRLAGLPVMMLGQSAGAHLAVWAASRTQYTPGGKPLFLPSSVVSLSGPLNLSRCATEGLPTLTRAVQAVMGGTPTTVPANYALGDPMRLKPLVPIHVVHGLQDEVVPTWAATDYVATAKAIGGTVDLTMIRGGHAAGTDARGPDWPKVKAVIDGALAG